MWAVPRPGIKPVSSDGQVDSSPLNDPGSAWLVILHVYFVLSSSDPVDMYCLHFTDRETGSQGSGSLRVPGRRWPAWALSPCSLVLRCWRHTELSGLRPFVGSRHCAGCQRRGGEPQLVPGLIDLTFQALGRGVNSPPAHSGESDMPGTAPLTAT